MTATGWDQRCRDAQDAVDDAKAVNARYQRKIRALIVIAVVGGIMFVGGCVTGGVGSALGLPLSDLGLALGAPGLLAGGGFGIWAGIFAADTSPHPADTLRTAERRLRDALMDQGSS